MSDHTTLEAPFREDELQRLVDDGVLPWTTFALGLSVAWIIGGAMGRVWPL